MEIREATAGDGDRIRDIAKQSFRASYAISPRDIETIIEEKFEPEQFTERITEDDRVALVAEEDDELLGFVEGYVVNDEEAEISWLHISPPHRGNGAGSQLFEQVLADLRERTVEDVYAAVLAQNQEGGEFFERFGFESADETTREYGERTVHVEIYREGPIAADKQAEDEYTVPEDEKITVDGETRYIDPTKTISGNEGQMLLVFEGQAREEHYGFYCTNCGTYTDSVDGQGTVVCENCGNEHRPEEWDGSYL